MGVVVEFEGLGFSGDFHLGVLVGGREAAFAGDPAPSQFPGVEEGRPVDELAQGGDEFGAFDGFGAGEGGDSDVLSGPIALLRAFPGLRE